MGDVLRSFKPVIALSRGLEVLRIVNSLKRATIRELHAQTGLDKATIIRALETLEHSGYVNKDTEQPVYYVTARTLALSDGFDRHIWMAGIAEPFLGEFRSVIGWPSDLAVNDGDEMVVVRTTRGQGPLSFNRGPGFRAPLLGTSLGRAYFAFCGDEERAGIIKRLALDPSPWNDIIRDPDRLSALLEEIRGRGFSLMADEYSQKVYGGSVWAVAVPVKTEHEVFGALNIMMLNKVVTLDNVRKNYLKQLMSTADKLAEAFRQDKKGSPLKEAGKIAKTSAGKTQYVPKRGRSAKSKNIPDPDLPSRTTSRRAILRTSGNRG
jgi:IclR family mhp operon transcriptional activator